MDVFQDCIAPALPNVKVKRLNPFHLSGDVEQTDLTCEPIL